MQDVLTVEPRKDYPEVVGDVNLLRFLRSSLHDVDLANTRYRLYVQVREDNNYDQIRDLIALDVQNRSIPTNTSSMTNMTNMTNRNNMTNRSNGSNGSNGIAKEEEDTSTVGERASWFHKHGLQSIESAAKAKHYFHFAHSVSATENGDPVSVLWSTTLGIGRMFREHPDLAQKHCVEQSIRCHLHCELLSRRRGKMVRFKKIEKFN